MKKTLFVSTIAPVAWLSAPPVWARTRPKLIKEGRHLLAGAKMPRAEKVRALLDESEKLHVPAITVNR